MVSIHLAAYNEPPDMLIETIQSLEAIDYPNFEVVVIDNNTKDPDVWQPVEEYCRDRPGVHVRARRPWPGYKSGALNLALARAHAPRRRDGRHRRRRLPASTPISCAALVGYFADPSVAFVQTPQDYREYEGDAYLTACYDAYRYFFVTTMPSRNERNSIIFAGTMGLLRRCALEEVGGWDEWCITEDAELSLRMLKAGYQGCTSTQSYGHGDHAADVRLAEEPAVPVVLRRHADPAHALARPAAVAIAAAATTSPSPRSSTTCSEPAVAQRPRVPRLHRRAASPARSC